MSATDDILKENKRRIAAANSTFNPVSGEGSILARALLEIPDFPIPRQWLPKNMLLNRFVRRVKSAGSIRRFVELENGDYSDALADLVVQKLFRVRCRYDFAFWAATLVYIKRKGGGEDMLFSLNRPQRRLISRFEELRIAGKPIRIILLKARQWGGSTVIQIYMAWLQLIHKKGLNSLIVGNLLSASNEVKDMFDRMLKAYPADMLHNLCDAYSPSEKKVENVGSSKNIQRIIQRNCKIKLGTAEKPDSARGGDYNLVHCTEVGLWVTTENKTPKEIVQSACSGILYRPYTMIVYESTAKGVGTFFHGEYVAARDGKSQFESFFVPWYEIEQYSLSVDDPAAFADALYRFRSQKSVDDPRRQPGQYLWWLWQSGATLEAINWYVSERRKYTEHASMASEYPSDDIEAFANSGEMVFDKYTVEAMRRTCKAPRFRGSVSADADVGPDALKNIRLVPGGDENLSVWDMPEDDVVDGIRISDRYLAVVDLGKGFSRKADFSVITVFDRLYRMDGGQSYVVAQWYGKADMDRVAWLSAQIARLYNNALLVIEKNSLDTNGGRRVTESDHAPFVLNELKDYYPNLYARKQSPEEIRENAPRVYGFHTNVATKPVIIDNLQRVIRDSLYVERDENCINELLVYEKKEGGKYGAVDGHHDDLVMTRAIAMQIDLHEMPLPRQVSVNSNRIINKPAVSAATI